MASEWIIPAITGAVGIAGIYATSRSGNKGREHAEVLAQNSNSHNVAMAQQQRRAEAYIEVLEMVESVGQWVSMTKPIFDDGTPTPSLPEFSEQVRPQVLMAAFGSLIVKKRFGEWRSTISNFMKDKNALDASEAMNEGVKNELWEAIEKSRTNEERARKALQSAVALELGGEVSR